MTRSRFFVLVNCLVWLVVSRPALADVTTDIAGLAAGSTKDKIDAVERLVSGGNSNAIPVLKAYLNGNLFLVKSDGAAVIGLPVASGVRISDARDGREIGIVKKSTLKKIRINNRLRKIVRSALGGMTLLSKNRDQRLTAAHDVFKSRDAGMIELLKTAISRETDDTVRAAFKRSLAAIQATSDNDPAVRVAALSILAEFTDQDVRALVSSILASEDSAGSEVSRAAGKALEQIESRLQARNIAASIFQGVSLGSVLLLAAMGLAVTFGVMGVINMAHGEMVMLGAYSTFIVQDLFRTYLAAYADWSVLVAVPVSFVVVGLIGVIIERCVIRFLYGRPLETLLATWGLSLIIQQLVRSIFGPTNQEVANPSWMSGATEVVGGLSLTNNRMWIIVFAMIVFVLVTVLMKKTAFGLRIRAVMQNRAMASSMGIRTGWVDALTFGLGSGIAGIAGVALSQIDNVSPNLGQAYIIDSFMVVVFGGVGNLWGTVVGALSLGIVNKFLEPVSGAVLAKILVLIAVILFIQKRPRGLFALKGRAVEG